MASRQNAPHRGTAKELAFNERLAQLQALRIILAILTLVVCAGGIGQRAAGRPPLLVATAAYLLTVVATEAFWRRTGSRRYGVHGLLLGADGLYLVLAVAVSGGMSSPVRYLLILDVVATTLVASYRSGIRLTLWECLLLQVAYELPRARLPGWWRFPTGPVAHRELMGFSVALVAVALLTGTAAAFNERSLRAGRRDLEVLTDFTRELERVVEPNVVGHQLCEALATGYGFERSLVAVVENDRLRVLAGRGTPATSHLAIDSVVRRVLAGEGPLLMKTLPRPQTPEEHGLAWALPDARDVLLVALRIEDGVLGVLVAERGPSTRAGLETRVLAAVEQLTAHTALVLRRAALLVELGRLADTDLLTGLANRGAFERSLNIELDRAARQGTPVGLLIADIDRFKRVNDEQGHPAGDEVLAELGALLREDLRGFDLAARYGGEEFAILLPGCAHAELWARAERLRIRVKEANVNSVVITLSIGAASSPPQPLDARALVAAADAALYQAKRAGRDRTCVDGTGGRPPAVYGPSAARVGGRV
ncbi:MAG: GGDEF domain-containing protein [Actinomycetota bacterium]|nr:GGDEF domain-containing protein [Actinomycetota bacterium]